MIAFQELEEFVVQKLCEAVTERCELGNVRQRCHLLEQMVYQWRKRAQQLQKQVIDLLTVLSLYKYVPCENYYFRLNSTWRGVFKKRSRYSNHR